METYEYYIKKENSFIAADNRSHSICINHPSRLCHALKKLSLKTHINLKRQLLFTIDLYYPQQPHVCVQDLLLKY